MSNTPQIQYRTARNFEKPPPLLTWYLNASGLSSSRGRALVFGAGYLREADALRVLGWKVDALETAASLKRRRELYTAFDAEPACRVIDRLNGGRYQLITVTHILEFIEQRQERVKILRDLAARLSKRGHLLLSLRGWSDVLAAKTQRRQGDGIVTGLGTWTRGYTVDEALELVRPADLRIVASPRTGRSRTPEQVRLVLTPHD